MESSKVERKLINFERILAVVCVVIYSSLVIDWHIYFLSSQDGVNKFVNGPLRSLWIDPLSYWPQVTVPVLIVFFVICIATIFGSSNFILRISKYLLLQALHQRLWTIGDGGMNLLVLSHLYICLFDLPLKPKIKHEIHRALLLLLRGQFLLIYLTAFISKLSGSEWVHGEALGLVVAVDKFHSAFLGLLFQTFPIIGKLLTLSVVTLQGLLFIGLAWSTGRTRNLILIMGTALHLGIAIHLGLIAFSLVMISHFYLFLEDSTESPINFLFKNQSLFYVGLALISLNYLGIGISELVSLRNKVIIEKVDTRSKETSLDEKKVSYASISKLFSFLLLDRLAEQKVIDLNSEYQTPAGKFCLRELLQFQAGVHDLPTSIKSIKNFSWEHWPKYFDLTAKPGEYSNFSYVLIQKIIEDHTKLPWKELLERYIPETSGVVSEVQTANLPHSPKTQAAFGLQGPVSLLSILKSTFSPKSFCMHSVQFCINGAPLKNGYYFVGSHGLQRLNLIFFKGKLYSMLTVNSDTNPNIYFY